MGGNVLSQQMAFGYDAGWSADFVDLHFNSIKKNESLLRYALAN